MATESPITVSGVSDEPFTIQDCPDDWSNGRSFLGWSTDPQATGPDYRYAVGNRLYISEDTHLYAIWGNNACTLTWNANGGEHGGAAYAGRTEFSVNVNSGSNLILPAYDPNVPTGSAYPYGVSGEFKHWAESWTSPEVVAGTTVTTSKTYYAQYDWSVGWKRSDAGSPQKSQILNLTKIGMCGILSSTDNSTKMQITTMTANHIGESDTHHIMRVQFYFLNHETYGSEYRIDAIGSYGITNNSSISEIGNMDVTNLGRENKKCENVSIGFENAVKFSQTDIGVSVFYAGGDSHGGPDSCAGYEMIFPVGATIAFSQ